MSFVFAVIDLLISPFVLLFYCVKRLIFKNDE